MNEQIKEELLKLAENVSKDTVETTFKIIDLYIQLTPNKIDDLVLPFLEQAKNFVLTYVDKIDGENNV